MILHVEYYSTGKLYSIGNYKNGLIYGYWKYYYNNGNLKSIKYYI